MTSKGQVIYHTTKTSTLSRSVSSGSFWLWPVSFIAKESHVYVFLCNHHSIPHISQISSEQLTFLLTQPKSILDQ